MDADLDSLLTVVFCTADDFLPTKAGNARRIVTDAEVVTLAVAQVLLGYHDSDRRFLAAAQRRLKHLFLQIPTQDAFHKRRARLEASIEWLIGVFAAQSPGYHDDMLVLDSTPVETARSRETVKRAGDSTLAGAIGDAAGYGYSPAHSRFFYGMRLHLLAALDGTPRAATLWSPERGEREVAITLLARGLHGGETVIADKGYAGQEFHAAAAELGATIIRPNRKTEPGQAPPDLRRPPTRRIDHPDHQEHPRTRTPRRPHPAQPPRPDLRPTARTRRLHHSQPQPRPPQPSPHPLHHLTVASLI